MYRLSYLLFIVAVIFLSACQRSFPTKDYQLIYGNIPGINNFGIKITPNLLINNQLKIPAKASAYENPLAEKVYLI